MPLVEMMGQPIGEYARYDFPSVEARGGIIALLSAYVTQVLPVWSTDPMRIVMLASAPLDRPAALFLSDGAVRAAQSAGIPLGPRTMVALEHLPAGVGVIFGDSVDLESRSQLRESS